MRQCARKDAPTLMRALSLKTRPIRFLQAEAFFIAGNTLYFRMADKASKRRGAGDAARPGCGRPDIENLAIPLTLRQPSSATNVG
jgi:hypothetical protein